MATTPALRSMLGMAASWAAAAVIGVTSIIYHRELGAAASRAMGLRPAEISVATKDQALPAAGARKRESDRAVELRAGQNGHFFAEAEINGRRIEVMIDTGASIVALTWEDALTAGVSPRDSDFTHRVSTANGSARVAPVMLSRVQIGDVMVRNVQAAVAEPGKLNITLVGNSFLGRLSRYEMRSGRLILEE
jgi:aspartyl protease family protein